MADPARQEQSALTAGWIDTAVRPDLYPPPVQRKRADQEPGQRTASPDSGTGEPLPNAVQAKMEHAFGADFSAARIHQGNGVGINHERTLERKADDLGAREAGPVAYQGNRPEGAGQGILRGGSGKRRRRIGAIQSGSFVRSQGAAPAAPAAGQSQAQGAEGMVAFVGSWSSPIADRTEDVDGTQVRMEDETDAQATMIADAVRRAKELVDAALGALDNVEANRATIEANFHTTEAEDITAIKGVYNKIKSAFSGTIPIEVESDDEDVVAYVYVLWSDIHLCAPWFRQTSDKRAGTIVHEMSHKYAGTDDNAYHYDAAYTTLSPKDAIANADSYQWFALNLVGYTG